jgi:hypothetical protein
MEQAGQVTLIFYEVGDLWKEPWLNIAAATFQRSKYTHVEIAIGDEAGNDGQIKNVCRIFNDPVGVEIIQRTGRNPAYHYLQLGCSKNAELKMLRFALDQKGKPFSNVGMARSLLWPRETTGESFFCAELVAAILRKGGLLDPNSNPGAATPQTLHTMYKSLAAVTANPYTLRDLKLNGSSFPSVVGRLLQSSKASTNMLKKGIGRNQSGFRLVSDVNLAKGAHTDHQPALTMHSLDMRKNVR